MDMSGQYVNYLAYFRNIFSDGANIFYNFSMNLGSNCYGLFAYYFSSPLNIILCLFSEQYLTEAIFALNIIKISLCATTMTIMLKNTTKLKKTSIIILSIMYSLMSYNIVYAQNIMWLDGVIYLPLVILGIENIIKKQSYFTYVIFLFLTILSNFYIGYMVGIFSVIYAILRFIGQSKTNTIKGIFIENKKSIGIYIKATIFTLMLSMIILLPVFLNLLNSKADIQVNNFEFDTYYTPLDAVSKSIIGAFNKEQLIFGAPNIYCGALCLIMICLYFTNKNISNKEKLLYIFLIIGLIFCFTVVPLNLIFHMLQSPVFFPFRNSFIFSFLLIYLTAKSMENIKGVTYTKFLKTQISIIFLVMLIGKLNYSYITTTNILLTIGFVFVTGTMFYCMQEKGKIYKIILILLVSSEMLINGYQIVKQFDYLERDSFVNSYNQVKNIIQEYKSSENEFYRIENELERTINDPMLYNYNGFSHYSSTSGKDNMNFLRNFGIRHNLVIENSSDTTLPMSSILGLQYNIVSNSKMKYINLEWFNQEKTNENNSMVLKNKYALNLGFLVSDNVKDMVLTPNSPMENKNKLFSAMANTEKQIFKEIEIQNIEEIENYNQKDMYLLYTAKNQIRTDSVKIYFDDTLYKTSSETNENSNNVIYIPKSVKNVKIEFIEDSKENFDFKLYEFNYENFVEIYDTISKNQLQVETNHSSYIKGKIKADKTGILLTSIIDDNGWKVKVDGQNVEKQVIAENLLAINLNEGEHTIEFIYTPPGFVLGTIIFFIGFILMIIDYIYLKIKGKVDVKNGNNKK